MKSIVPFLALLATIPTAAHSQVTIPINPERGAVVIAHRGCWQQGAPEVSAAAIRACEPIAPDLIEVDVRRTRDGVLVLIHDDTVDRTTNGTGKVEDLTFDEIRKFRLRTGSGGPYSILTDERIPTLEEGLSALPGNSILHLHLYTDAAQEVRETVERSGKNGKVTAWVGAEPAGNAQEESQMAGSIGLISIIKHCAPNRMDRCWKPSDNSLNKFATRSPSGFYLIPDQAMTVNQRRNFFRSAANSEKPSHARVMASTLFDLDKLPIDELRLEWSCLLDSGIDMIMTDRPSELIAFLSGTHTGRIKRVVPACTRD